MGEQELPATVSSEKFLNLLVYSDSLAFPRKDGTQDLAVTYPFRLRDLIERDIGIRTNVVFRGQGAAVMRIVKETLMRDLGYFSGATGAINVAVFQFGIVDSAPRPITYAFISTLRRLPVVGGRVAAFLVKYRRRLQTIWSYTLTPTRKFRREYAEILRECRRASIKTVAVGLPLPPASMETRSPGFRRNVALYNGIIRESIPESFCDAEAGMSDELRAMFLMPDGYHLTPAGHQYYAELLLEQIRKLL